MGLLYFLIAVVILVVIAIILVLIDRRTNKKISTFLKEMIWVIRYRFRLLLDRIFPSEQSYLAQIEKLTNQVDSITDSDPSSISLKRDINRKIVLCTNSLASIRAKKALKQKRSEELKVKKHAKKTAIFNKKKELRLKKYEEQLVKVKKENEVLKEKFEQDKVGRLAKVDKEYAALKAKNLPYEREKEYIKYFDAKISEIKNSTIERELQAKEMKIMSLRDRLKYTNYEDTLLTEDAFMKRYYRYRDDVAIPRKRRDAVQQRIYDKLAVRWNNFKIKFTNFVMEFKYKIIDSFDKTATKERRRIIKDKQLDVKFQREKEETLQKLYLQKDQIELSSSPDKEKQLIKIENEISSVSARKLFVPVNAMMRFQYGLAMFGYYLIYFLFFKLQIWLAYKVIGVFFTVYHFILFAPFKVARFFKDFSINFKRGFLSLFSWHVRENISGYVYLLPVLILTGVFTFYPIVSTLFISFTRGYNYLAGTFEAMSIASYTRVLGETQFQNAVKNTLFLVFVGVPISTLLSLGISLALSSIKFLKGFFQTIFFLPYLTNSIAIGLVFKVLFMDSVRTTDGGLRPGGVFNSIISFFGGIPMNFFGTGNTTDLNTWWSCMLMVIIYTVWSALAFKIMLFIGAIQGVDKSYYQAAQIDGASRWAKISKITIPMISPIIFYVLTTSFIGTWKSYTSIVALYGPDMGPAGDQSSMMITIVGYIMDKMALAGGTNGIINIASAGAVILLLIILVFTAIQMSISSKKVHY